MFYYLLEILKIQQLNYVFTMLIIPIKTTFIVICSQIL